MRDIVVLVFLFACIGAAIYRAWYGVLSLAVFSYLNPHAYAWGFVRTLPAYQILFIVVAISTLISKDRQFLPNDWRVPAFFLLWFYFLITTSQAYAQDLAWARLWLISKIYLPFIFMLVLINTRQKLFYLICTTASALGIIAVKGGLFAILTGFNYRVYGPPRTQFAENNAFAVAVLIALPLLILWRREIKNRYVRLGLLGAIPLFLASALSSWSRGALLTMMVLGLVMLWHSGKKYYVLPVVLIGAFTAFNMLPDAWFDRMDTLTTYEEDASAMSRLQVWRDGWNHTLTRPLVGAGFEGWTYVTERDWHNSFIEMLSEHGFIAFGIWISLIIGSLVSLTRLPMTTRGVEGLEWVNNYCYMIRASLIAYVVGTMFLGLSYWDLLYHLIFISVLIKKFALEELAEKPEEPKTMKKRPESFVRRPVRA